MKVQKLKNLLLTSNRAINTSKTSKASEDFLASLPKELLLMVLSNLDSIGFLTLAQTSKGLQGFIHENAERIARVYMEVHPHFSTYPTEYHIDDRFTRLWRLEFKYQALLCTFYKPCRGLKLCHYCKEPRFLQHLLVHHVVFDAELGRRMAYHILGETIDRMAHEGRILKHRVNHKFQSVMFDFTAEDIPWMINWQTKWC